MLARGKFLVFFINILVNVSKILLFLASFLSLAIFPILMKGKLLIKW